MRTTLKPLEQWICDDCGEIIDGIKAGWIEWKVDFKEDQENILKYDFRIVHHANYSPHKTRDGCYYSNHDRGGDNHLDRVTGADGLVTLLSWVHIGNHISAENRGPSVRDYGEWAEIVRRLHVPFYEEARLYLDRVDEDGINECAIYSQYHLENVIKYYGDKDDN